MLWNNILYQWKSLQGVVANILDSDIVVSELEIWSRYYVHFRTNTFLKDMNSLCPPALD